MIDTAQTQYVVTIRTTRGTQQTLVQASNASEAIARAARAAGEVPRYAKARLSHRHKAALYDT